MSQREWVRPGVSSSAFSFNHDLKATTKKEKEEEEEGFDLSLDLNRGSQ